MDKRTAQSVKNYNRIAITYDNTFDGKFTRSFKEELTNAVHLEDSFKVLDVACGNGRLLEMLSDKAKIQAYGADISENMIKEAGRRYPEIQFVSTNSSDLPYEDEFFDVITVSAAFHHFSEPEKFLSEAERILKPGGCLYIADPYYPPIVRQAANLMIPLFGMGDVKVYSRKELAHFLQVKEFQDVAVRRFGIIGYLLTGIKK